MGTDQPTGQVHEMLSHLKIVNTLWAVFTSDLPLKLLPGFAEVPIDLVFIIWSWATQKY